ncbi:XdhC family protein [Hyphomicrobium sp.]|uniref:XdhC family protein n=1 Tax=Hyphomicrobium sp. TaxID=82 RepID=UPI000FAB1EE5|nr:XdhC family protein [Hyphomicrobium sp.]RUP09173.1 MAG: XdhC family protein [Hyphomicrobium sp.]
MTLIFQRFDADTGLLADEDVLPHLARWQNEGLRTALVTLVGVDGGAPRQPGAQMAVAEDGSFVGYLSGGCLEAAVVLEAQAAIRAGENRLVRYGKGSPYFDVKLPCGSGLDLYFDQGLGAGQVRQLLSLRAARQACSLRTSLVDGTSIVASAVSQGPLPRSARDKEHFDRYYSPPLRLLLLGSGPLLNAIAVVAQVSGLEIAIWSPDEVTRNDAARRGISAFNGTDALQHSIEALDYASAAVLVFHDHEAEPEILARALETECFYLGVLGNHAVHRQRLEVLQAKGFTANARGRLHAPVGSIPGAKSKATLATGVLAEILAEAKIANLVS